ncbi:MAG: hypothetical protein ACFFDN_40830, partial [Candidatus Hodarchaeota archaeon]
MNNNKSLTINPRDVYIAEEKKKFSHNRGTYVNMEDHLIYTKECIFPLLFEKLSFDPYGSFGVKYFTVERETIKGPAELRSNWCTYKPEKQKQQVGFDKTGKPIYIYHSPLNKKLYYPVLGFTKKNKLIPKEVKKYFEQDLIGVETCNDIHLLKNSIIGLTQPSRIRVLHIDIDDHNGEGIEKENETIQLLLSYFPKSRPIYFNRRRDGGTHIGLAFKEYIDRDTAYEFKSMFNTLHPKNKIDIPHISRIPWCPQYSNLDVKKLYKEKDITAFRNEHIISDVFSVFNQIFKYNFSKYGISIKDFNKLLNSQKGNKKFYIETYGIVPYLREYYTCTKNNINKSIQDKYDALSINTGQKFDNLKTMASYGLHLNLSPEQLAIDAKMKNCSSKDVDKMSLYQLEKFFSGCHRHFAGDFTRRYKSTNHEYKDLFFSNVDIVPEEIKKFFKSNKTYHFEILKNLNLKNKKIENEYKKTIPLVLIEILGMFFFDEENKKQLVQIDSKR